MFSLCDGPTALRPEYVRALSFCSEEAVLTTRSGVRRALCAVAGVWNQSKGAVVLVVHHLEPSEIERYVFGSAITSSEALDAAVDEGIAFAESLGFAMDPPRFEGLAEPVQRERMRAWNAIRKLRRRAADGGARTTPVEPAAADPGMQPLTSLDPVGPSDPPTSIELSAALDAQPPAEAAAEDPGEAPAEAARGAGAGPGGAVLGRIQLVQRSEAPRLTPLARLRSWL
jgi:hypothetical protein